jgi:hypothetical protein
MSIKTVQYTTRHDVPLDELMPHPQNANEGDVGAVITSIQENGWYGHIGVDVNTGWIVWGHTRRKALMAMGEKTCPEVRFYEELSSVVALRMLTVDNRSCRLGMDNSARQLENLKILESDNALLGSGFDEDDMDRLAALLAGDDDVDDPGDGDPRESFRIVIHCDCEDEQSHISMQLASMGVEHEIK